MAHVSETAGRLAATVKSFFLVILFLQYSEANTDIQSTTYTHMLDNGQKVTCNKCLPGQYFIDDCITNGGNALCAPCDDGTYNSKHTIAHVCRRCNTECRYPDREYIAANCTKVSNISCKCREGLYREPFEFGLCLFYNSCPPGKGVVKEGTNSSDTVCEDCPKNYFSANSSKTERCQQCRTCRPETIQYQDCRPDADRICGPPRAEDLPIEAIIGIVVGAVFLVLVIITLVCCFCVMRGRCAAIRKKVCKCCYRPYQECTQHDQSGKYSTANSDEIRVTVPDLIKNTVNGHGGTVEVRQMNDRHNGVAIGNGTVGHTTRNAQSGDQSPGSLNSVFFQLREDLISQDYPQFFRFLFTDDADVHINESKLDFSAHGVKEIIYQILVKWKDIEKENATTDKILTALKDWDRNDLLEKYRIIFGQSNVQMDTLKEDRNSSRSSVTTEV